MHTDVSIDLASPKIAAVPVAEPAAPVKELEVAPLVTTDETAEEPVVETAEATYVLLL